MSTATAEVQVKKPRDPREDPQVGDAIYRDNPVHGTRRRRKVVRRNGFDIYYVDDSGKERKCWISSWISWANTAEVEGAEKVPTLAAKKLILERIRQMPKTLLSGTPGVPGKDIEQVLRQALATENEMVTEFRHSLRRMLDDLETPGADQKLNQN